jgi:outer membrane protein
VFKKTYFVILFLFFTSLSFSQAKMGYIVSEQIVQQLPEAQAVIKQLENLQKDIVDTLQNMEKDLQARAAEFQQKESLMTDDAKKKANKELLELDTKNREYRQKKSDELQKKQETLLAPIMDKIQKALEAVAKEENLAFIFDKSQRIPVLLYGDAEYNYTNKVLDYLIRGSKTTKKKGK